MTARIYYTDPFRRTFDASVTRALQHEGRPAAVLDSTAFYPTSGGQPFDVGRLDDAEVIDVVDMDDDVVHVLSRELAAGSRVHGELDWTRRFDHMQQHTGQHVLSAACDRIFDNRTTSFHMGAELSTIDLAREMTGAEIERAVDDANAVVWEDRPVSIRFVSAEEARTLPLRKEPAREGPLRLIEIADFDLSACGGTHVARTGAIGMIVVAGSERVRGGSRISFACGGRALRAWRTYRDAVAGSSRVLSVLPHELAAAVERSQAEARGLRKTIGGLQESLASYEAARLLETAEVVEGMRVVVQTIDGWDAAGLKSMAAGIVSAGNTAVALLSSATPAILVVARSADVSRIDAGKVLRRLVDRFGGKGGGRPELAQGGGLSGSPADIAAAARELLASR